MIVKNKLKILILLLFTVFLSHYFFFNKKNIIVLIDNTELIDKKKKMISDLNNEKSDLEKKFNEFKNNSVFRELIVKEKLYLKNELDRVIFYELDN